MPTRCKTIRRMLVVSILLAVTACEDVPDSTEKQVRSEANSPFSEWKQLARALGEEPATPGLIKFNTATASSAPPVSSLVGRLQEKIAADPQNLGHRTLLVQTYAFLGDQRAAEEALSEAIALGADENQLRAQLHAAVQGVSGAASW